ncbi:MAG: nucleotidyltransferase domain-containing protein [Sedimenticola sp.]
MNTTKIVEHLRDNFPSLLAVYGFGSRFTGHSLPDSDLDLAILIEGKAEPEVLWEQSEKLAELTHFTVDLLDFRSASTVMQYQIITVGQRLWQRDAQASLYESFVLSEKTALDTARAGILQDIASTGRIYG